MRGSQLAVLGFVALCLVPASVLGGFVVSGNPELSASLADNRVTPGENTQLSLQVNNRGEIDQGSSSGLESQVTKARGLEVDLQSGDAPVTVETDGRTVGQLPGEQSTELPFEITVADDADPGTYTMEADVEYTYYSQITQTDSGRRVYNERDASKTFDVTLRVEEDARFEIVATESDVQVGDSGTVAVTMENTGTATAHDTSVTTKSSNGDIGFGQSQSATRYVGDWAPGERQTVEYTVTAGADAEQQRYAFSATASYEDDDGVPAESDSLSFGVVPEPETAFSTSDVTSSLRVGEEGTLRGTITNDGEQTARDVVVALTSEHGNLDATDREYSVGTLEPGASDEFAFTLDVSDSAESGPKQFVLAAEYRDSDGDSRTSDDLPVRQDVAPGSDAFRVTVANGTVTNGGSTNLEVQVTNTANETLSAISAKMFADSPIGVSDSEAYVDELEPGETATMTFSVGASGALPKQYPLSLDFEYDDADGDTLLSDRYRLAVDVSERESGGGGFPLTLVGVGVVVVVAVGGYMRFR
ncbi:COG1361 S-layer family protein [Halorientalis halophila]|uniref:COG1361 S-layer family protein n=1 Tax=Halorientalis halophila TaxID=3108499 RepID=UPI0030088B00